VDATPVLCGGVRRSPCAAMYCLQGVMVSHGNLAHNLNAITRSLHAKDKTVVVSWLPQYHDMGLIGSFLGVVCVADFARSARRPMSYLSHPHAGLAAAIVAVLAPTCRRYRSSRTLPSGSRYDPCSAHPGCSSRFAHASIPPLCRQAVSQYGGTHLQAPSFAYGLTARKFAAQQRFKLQDMDLSSVQHIFNAVRVSTACDHAQHSVHAALTCVVMPRLSPSSKSPSASFCRTSRRLGSARKP